MCQLIFKSKDTSHFLLNAIRKLTFTVYLIAFLMAHYVMEKQDRWCSYFAYTNEVELLTIITSFFIES